MKAPIRLCYLVLISALLLLGGCGSDTVLLDQSTKRPAKKKNEPVEVFMNLQPTRAFQPIATTQVIGDERELQKNIEEIKAEARKVGGDAVIIQLQNSALTPGSFGGITVKKGIIIVWK